MHRKNLPRYWQGLEELEDSPEVRELLEREFPVDASVFESEFSRRNFLKLMAASLSLAGLYGCESSPAEKIVTAVKTPEGILPGKSVFYARSLNREGQAIGVLVETYMGRPIKIEGNPEHPMSLGASDVILQSEILNLYDPDRLKTPLKNGVASDWETFGHDWQKRRAILEQNQGLGLRFLSCDEESEVSQNLWMKLLKQYPKAKFVVFDPLAAPGQAEATQMTYGKEFHPFYHFDRTQVILSLGDDFLSDGTAGLRYARDFATRRRVHGNDGQKMNRLYVVESQYSLTGAMADHRLPLKRSSLEVFIQHLAVSLGVLPSPPSLPPLESFHQKWLNTVVKELKAHKGSAVIAVDPHMTPEIQGLVFLMNEKLESIGSLITYHADGRNRVQERKDFISLVKELEEGQVTDLIILSGNPAYASPGDLKFSQLLRKVKFSVTLTEAQNETSSLSLWSLPRSHPLECWSDGRAKDGTLSINQAIIAPLYQSKSKLEFLSLLLGEQEDSHQLVKEYWNLSPEKWQEALSLGLLKGGPSTEVKVKSLSSALPEIKRRLKETVRESTLELHLAPDPYLRDGRHANNGWLQELPRPISKTCWGNAAFVSPSLAHAHNLTNNQVISLTTTAGAVDVPVWIMPGLAADVIQLHFGHGRTKVGRVGGNIGSDSFKLWHSSNADFVERNVSLKKTGKIKEVACTQLHHHLAGTEPVKVADVSKLPFLKKESLPQPSLYPEPPIPPSEEYAWGMTVDLNVCIGCNACVIGCQSENNIPIVGEEQVKLGREMHWLRIDRYFEGGPDFSKVHFQPLACVHCEKAPCEIVCPVAATTHSDEGLNQMVYNRCVGTRYCSNNCPYKVRRFNFLEYHDRRSPELKMRSNPEVTVRSRGVMEKCTYCIQRISEAKISAELEDRKVRDGEVKTACQQACPTQAIVFGNLKDPVSEVSRRQKEVQSYELLGELGTKPRTQYLMRWKNPHPELRP